MMLRIQHERMLGGFFPTLREYAAFYGLDERRLKRAASDAIVMHPGPINRGVEIMGDIADGAASVILDQVRSGVAVRMAVLYLLAGGDREAPAQGRRERAEAECPPMPLGRQRPQEAGANADRLAASSATLDLAVYACARLHRHARPPPRAGPGMEGDDRDGDTRGRAGVHGGACIPNTRLRSTRVRSSDSFSPRPASTGRFRSTHIGCVSKGQAGLSCRDGGHGGRRRGDSRTTADPSRPPGSCVAPQYARFFDLR